jgi:hypothetical protein
LPHVPTRRGTGCGTVVGGGHAADDRQPTPRCLVLTAGPAPTSRCPHAGRHAPAWGWRLPGNDPVSPPHGGTRHVTRQVRRLRSRPVSLPELGLLGVRPPDLRALRGIGPRRRDPVRGEGPGSGSGAPRGTSLPALPDVQTGALIPTPARPSVTGKSRPCSGDPGPPPPGSRRHARAPGPMHRRVLIRDALETIPGVPEGCSLREDAGRSPTALPGAVSAGAGRLRDESGIRTR